MHILYRFYCGNLLFYIGITNNPGRRFTTHSSEKPWWSFITHITLEHHESRAALLAAEKAAIQDEMPLHNVTYNTPINLNERTETDDIWEEFGSHSDLELEQKAWDELEEKAWAA